MEMIMTTNTNVILYCGRTVPQAFFDSVQQQVEEVLPAMDPEACYTSKMLCGMEFWELLLNNGQRRTAGRCLAHMVSQELLPLVFAESKSKHPKWYQLK
jgi:hypothetical protein